MSQRNQPHCLSFFLSFCLSIAFGLSTKPAEASPRKLTSNDLYAELQKKEGSEQLSSGQLRKYSGLARVLRLTGRERSISVEEFAQKINYHSYTLKHAFAVIDKNGDYRLSFAEVASTAPVLLRHFGVLDLNADGAITLDELFKSRIHIHVANGGNIERKNSTAGVAEQIQDTDDSQISLAIEDSATPISEQAGIISGVQRKSNPDEEEIIVIAPPIEDEPDLWIPFDPWIPVEILIITPPPLPPEEVIAMGRLPVSAAVRQILRSICRGQTESCDGWAARAIATCVRTLSVSAADMCGREGNQMSVECSIDGGGIPICP